MLMHANPCRSSCFIGPGKVAYEGGHYTLRIRTLLGHTHTHSNAALARVCASPSLWTCWSTTAPTPSPGSPRSVSTSQTSVSVAAIRCVGACARVRVCMFWRKRFEHARGSQYRKSRSFVDRRAILAFRNLATAGLCAFPSILSP